MMRRMRWLGALVLGVAHLPQAPAAEFDEYWDRRFGSVETTGEPGHGLRVLVSHMGAAHAGGRFSTVDGRAAANVAKWDGTRWTPLSVGLGAPSSDSMSYVIALASHGELLCAGGRFGRAAQDRLDNVAAWDGHKWMDLAEGINGTVEALASCGGYLYVGGSFNSVGRVRALNIARWDGRAWSAAGGGVSRTNYTCADCEPNQEIGRVRTLLSDGTRLFVGGLFERVGGIAATNIAVWSEDKWSPLGNGLDADVWQIVVLGDRVYAGGEFRRNGQIVGLMQWDGVKWSPVGAGVTEPYGYAQGLATDGRLLYVGGNFKRIGGVAAEGLAVWDGVRWGSLGSGLSGFRAGEGVTQLLAAGDSLYVAGLFSRIGNVAATNVARWHFPRILNATTTDGRLEISWPRPDSDFVLESASALVGADWRAVEQTPAIVRERWTIKNTVTSGPAFYRLRQK